ncbi:MAG TPA: septum formation initiator family protein [Candidatus Paceibacterota bacterium]|nr:septum formation initiator family protein [Candidatus Paceibacterota bacterium]HPT17861.1 septum formation initiator family protein [Candidatus Paceibacterota bacterium]
MRNFQQKKGFKSFLQSKPVLFLLFVFVVIFAWKIFSLIGKMQETYKNRDMEREKISELEERKQKLLYEIEKLNTEDGKEKVIRENFGMVKEGEEVIVIVEDTNKKSIEEVKKPSRISIFFNKLFGR